jgi:hypothetical protein
MRARFVFNVGVAVGDSEGWKLENALLCRFRVGFAAIDIYNASSMGYLSKDAHFNRLKNI